MYTKSKIHSFFLASTCFRYRRSTRISCGSVVPFLSFLSHTHYKSYTFVADKINDMFIDYDTLVDLGEQEYLDKKHPRIIYEPFRADIQGF